MAEVFIGGSKTDGDVVALSQDLLKKDTYVLLLIIV
jgi:hypothetical protein